MRANSNNLNYNLNFNKTQIPALKENNTNNPKRFIIRSIEDWEYLAVESEQLNGQLHNISLSKKNVFQTNYETSRLYESFKLTSGGKSKKISDVKNAFKVLDM